MIKAHTCMGIMLFTSFVISGSHADVLFDNLAAPASGGAVGFINSGSSAGGEVSIAGAGTIQSFTWADQFGDFGSTSDLKLSFFSVDPGTDSTAGTTDDKIGSLLGSYTAVNYSITGGGVENTISGFSIDVPETFIWTIWSESHSFAIRATGGDTATTGSFLKGYWFLNGGDLTTGAVLNDTTIAPKVQFTGVIPEPSVIALSTVFGAGMFFVRRIFMI